MSTSSPSHPADVAELTDLARRVYEIAGALHAGGRGPEANDAAVQQLLTAAVQLYVQKRIAEQDLKAFVEDTITATDVSIVTTAMLEAVDLQLFELTLWHGWGRP
jgi:hypothetical protein